MSTAAGFKEFADADAALFDGSLLMNLNTEEDFETEFRRLLTSETRPYESYNTTEIYNNISSPAHEFVITTPVLSEDYYPSPSTESKSSKISMKFEEDPLSTILNKQNPPKPAEIKKKRGRPSNLKFKSMEYFEEQSRIQSDRKKDTNSSISILPAQLHLRDRRSEDDKYSPIWIRGHGIDREGLCPLCSPPVWLKIKQSAYWYHMNFFHGICAATGQPYKRPISYRFAYEERNCKRVVEGHCGSCLHWIQ